MFVRSLFLLIHGLGAPARAVDVPAPAPTAEAAPRAEAIEILVQGGYHPDRIVVKEGQPVRLVFLRTEYTGCTLEVVFPTLGRRHELPAGEPVVVDLGVLGAGEIPFHCGMKMIHGTVVVEPAKVTP